MPERGKRLVLRPDGQVQVEEFEVPAPGPDQILVRIHTTQVSAGTEFNGVRQRRTASPAEQCAFEPVGLGYNAAGRVAAVGEKISDFTVGDRVLCSGNHGTHWLVTPSRALQESAISQEFQIEKSTR